MEISAASQRRDYSTGTCGLTERAAHGNPRHSERLSYSLAGSEAAGPKALGSDVDGPKSRAQTAKTSMAGKGMPRALNSGPPRGRRSALEKSKIDARPGDKHAVGIYDSAGYDEGDSSGACPGRSRSNWSGRVVGMIGRARGRGVLQPAWRPIRNERST